MKMLKKAKKRRDYSNAVPVMSSNPPVNRCAEAPAVL